VDEDIRYFVRVLGDEVARRRAEYRRATESREPLEDALAVALNATGPDADAARLAGLAIVNEDVSHPIGVVRDQIRCLREERDKSPVGRHLSAAVESIALHAARPDACQLVAVLRSRTKTCVFPLVPPATRFVASERRLTKRPSADIPETPLKKALGWTPFGPRSPARSCRFCDRVCSPARSPSLLGPGTILGQLVSTETNRPSADMIPPEAPRSQIWPPVRVTLTRAVFPVHRSWTNTSAVPLLSLGTRLSANDVNETYRPLAATRVPRAPLLSATLPGPTLTRRSLPVLRS
jgi:hypothetical protein